MKTIALFGALSMLAVVAGCSGASAEGVGEGEGAVVGKEAALHFVLAGAAADGGRFTMSLANGGNFACPQNDDAGTIVQADRCYVSDMIFAGLDDATRATAVSALQAKQGFVEGTITSAAPAGEVQAGRRVTLNVSATFLAASAATLAAGKYYSVHNNGRVCVRAPCDDIDATELGTSTPVAVADLTFAITGATDAVASATTALSKRNGRAVLVYGSAGADHGFEVREVFTALANPPVTSP